MPTCPICSQLLVTLIKRRDKYTLLQCKSCSFITSEPLPTSEELARYYAGSLFNKPEPHQEKERERVIDKDVRIIIADMEVPAGGVGKSLLDCGGGTGHYAAAFARHGFLVTFIDLDPAACNYVQEKNSGQFKVVEGDALKYNFKEKFDFIFCNQLIEHYPDPNQLIKHLKKNLSLEGIIILTTPNQNSKEFYFRPKWSLSYIYMATGWKLHKVPKAIFTFLKKPWICCDPPRHLHSFNPKNLTMLLEKNGFTVIKLFTEYSTSQHYSLRKYRDFSFHSLRDILKIILNIYALAGVCFLRRWDRNNKRGSNLVAYAKNVKFNL
ncbi:TPA: class I SAM-dependent methyltransferase [Candidatus Woesearchaeota archaeon]|nr:class I SAM-dependent methyltransferase [Candidatus Woesearchaeota archaeon]